MARHRSHGDQQRASAAKFVPLPVDRVGTSRDQTVTVMPFDPTDVPWVPTDSGIAHEMLKLAKVGPEDVVYDLGCGDGRIVIAAAKDFGARAVGVDLDAKLIQECRENAQRAGVNARVTFVQKSFFEVDLSPATVLALYLLPSVNVRLRPNFLSQLRPGSRIVMNQFDIGDWQADQLIELGGRQLRLWIVPAQVTGEWKCVIGPGAAEGEERQRVTLKLERRYQHVMGIVEKGGRKSPVLEGRLVGDRITLRVTDWDAGGRLLFVEARVEGKSLRGVCRHEGEAPTAFGGTRG